MSYNQDNTKEKELIDKRNIPLTVIMHMCK